MKLRLSYRGHDVVIPCVFLHERGVLFTDASDFVLGIARRLAVEAFADLIWLKLETVSAAAYTGLKHISAKKCNNKRTTPVYHSNLRSILVWLVSSSWSRTVFKHVAPRAKGFTATFSSR